MLGETEATPPKRIEATLEGEVRRKEILNCAAQLFASQGYDDTSISEIAQAASLKKASLYHYFPSKNDILLAVLSDGMDQLWADAAETLKIADPAKRLDALLTAHLRNFEQRMAHIVVFLMEQRVMLRDPIVHSATTNYIQQRRRYDQLYVDTIKEGQRLNAFRDDDPVLLAYAILGMVNWMVQWYDPKGRLTLDQISRTLKRCALTVVEK